MSLKSYKTWKKLEIASKFGEVILIILLIIKLSQLATGADLPYLMAVFFMAIIVLVSNILTVFAQNKAMREIKEKIS